MLKKLPLDCCQLPIYLWKKIQTKPNLLGGCPVGNYLSLVNESTSVNYEVCSPSTIKIPEQLVLHSLFRPGFTSCSSISIANFERVNTS